MLIRQIVLLTGALFDTYFYANKLIFSYLSVLEALGLCRYICFLHLIDLDCTFKDFAQRLMSYSIIDKINLCQEQQEHHALPSSLWSHCTVGYVQRFINSCVLCFWLNTQQPI